MRFRLLGITLAAIASPAIAAAQPTQLSDCVDMTDDAERLACFDTVMKAPAPEQMSPSSAATAPLAPETEVQKKRRFFGLRLPGGGATKPEDFGKREKPEDKLVTQITSEITNIEYRRKNAYRITLANGQVWQQLSSDDNYIPQSRKNPKTYSATVKEASFGSFKMTVEPMGRTIKVRRIQ